MNRWLKLVVGVRFYKVISSNLGLLAYIMALFTFLVINSYSGQHKCKRLNALEIENKKYRWEYFELKAKYTEVKSRKSVMPENYANIAEAPYTVQQ